MSDATVSQPRPAAQRRTWDLILTIVLLVVYVIVTISASVVGLFLAFAGDSCGASSTCDTDQIATGMLIAVGGVWIPALFVLAGAVILLVVRKLAFWVPLVGVALTIGILCLGFAVATSAVVPN